MPSIVQINISQVVAPLPLTLQETGAVISQGATNLLAGTYSLLTAASSLTPLLAGSLSLISLTWSAGTVLATASANISGLTIGDKFITTIAGAAPAGYNGTYLATVTGAATFTFALAGNPGTETIPGNYTPANQGELLAMVDTFFGQGSNQAVYVLELGPGDATGGPTALQTFITANPNFFYSYLVPRLWDASAGLLALIAANEALSAKTNFFVTTTIATYTAYTNLMNSCFAMIEAPGIPLTEFSCAAPFQVSLNYNPGSSNRMTPFAFSYLFGVTPYPPKGNQALLTTLKAANINVVGTGAEGGISNAIILWGTMMDGNDFTYWYSVDWIQLNADQAIANAVINGSNNPLNPLYYNQDGINVLQDVVVQVVRSAITFGLATGTVARAALDGPVFSEALDSGTYEDQDVVNAVPFITYTEENPSAYAAGSYGGLSVVYIPQRGFKQIIFNIEVTSFISQ